MAWKMAPKSALRMAVMKVPLSAAKSECLWGHSLAVLTVLHLAV